MSYIVDENMGISGSDFTLFDMTENGLEKKYMTKMLMIIIEIQDTAQVMVFFFMCYHFTLYISTSPI